MPVVWKWNRLLTQQRGKADTEPNKPSVIDAHVLFKSVSGYHGCNARARRARASHQRRLPCLQMHVRKTQKLFPIECRDCVRAGSIVISDGVHDRLIERRHLVRTEAQLSQ